MHTNIAGLRRNIKNFTHSYSDAQVKVREATSNDPWGPSSTLMAEISDFTYNVVAFTEVMGIVWKRLNDHGKYWRHVYKGLVLLEYLIKTGSEKVVQQSKENIYIIQTLREFQYYEEGKDQGTNVREKAKQLVALLKDEEKLKEERAKSMRSKERFTRSTTFGSSPALSANSMNNNNTRVNPELEEVRPSNQDEEELQLQLALAMSKEEADAEDAKRRSDDIRLQLALSQSQNDFKETPTRPEPRAPPQSNLVDLLDISFGDPYPAAAPAAPKWEPATTDPWKLSNDSWGAASNSTDSSPAHYGLRAATNNNHNNYGMSNWENNDPFKTDAWNQNSKPNDFDIFGATSKHSTPQKTSASLLDFDAFASPLKTTNQRNNNSVANNSTNPFSDFSEPQAADKPIDPWAAMSNSPYSLQGYGQNNGYQYQYNNNNNDELIVTKSYTSAPHPAGANGQSLYPHLNANHNAGKGLFVE